MRVFICSPYSAPLPSTRAANVARSLVAAAQLIRKGHQPFAPLTAHYIDIVAATSGMPISYERWMEFSLAWLEVCHAVLVLGSSPGADREVARALELGIPVYDRIEDVPDASSASDVAD